MRQITLSDQDAAQVKAILLTHAEMQDRSAIESEQLAGRLRKDAQSDEEREAADDQDDASKDLIEDSDNLKRIAALFN